MSREPSPAAAPELGLFLALNFIGFLSIVGGLSAAVLLWPAPRYVPPMQPVEFFPALLSAAAGLICALLLFAAARIIRLLREIRDAATSRSNVP